MDTDISLAEKEARLLHCLGEPTRLQIVKLLADGEKYVGEIVDAINREQSLISHHLKALKKCNIVIARQRAQKVYYKLIDPRLAQLVLIIESLVCEIPLCEPTEEEAGTNEE